MHQPGAGICLLDKLALRMDIWTTLHVAHMPTLRRHLAHRGGAYGLTRYACRIPFEIPPLQAVQQRHCMRYDFIRVS